MRRWIALALCLALLGCGCGLAETVQKAPDFIMEGYDGDSANHKWDSSLFFVRMQEKTGISFQFSQSTDFEGWTERKKGIAAGEDLPDVLFKAALTTAETRDMYAGGILIDLRPYLEEYAPNLWSKLQSREDWMTAVQMEDGAIPALPNFNGLQNNDVMWINTDWLSRVKMEKPTTADELTEVLRQFKAGDPNRNGKDDEIPLSFISMWELRFLAHAFGIIDNDYYVTVKDGQVTTSLTSEENRAFLTWLHQLWAENLIDHRGFSTADSLRQITDEKTAIPYGMFLSPSPLTVIPSAALEQYRILEPLNYNGKQIYRDLTGDIIRGTFAITSACKEPEKLVAWVDVLYTEEGSRLAQLGLEGEDYIWNEEGFWEWNADMETVANYILPDSTIAEGGSAPGWTDTEVQMKYADRLTRENIEQLAAYRQYLVMPYPMVCLNAEDEAKLAQIQKPLMQYAEETMAQFVTGDLEMNDQNWNAFAEKVQELGLNEMISILQGYIK